MYDNTRFYLIYTFLGLVKFYRSIWIEKLLSLPIRWTKFTVNKKKERKKNFIWSSYFLMLICVLTNLSNKTDLWLCLAIILWTDFFLYFFIANYWHHFYYSLSAWSLLRILCNHLDSVCEQANYDFDVNQFSLPQSLIDSFFLRFTTLNKSIFFRIKNRM